MLLKITIAAFLFLNAGISEGKNRNHTELAEPSDRHGAQRVRGAEVLLGSSRP